MLCCVQLTIKNGIAIIMGPKLPKLDNIMIITFLQLQLVRGLDRMMCVCLRFCHVRQKGRFISKKDQCVPRRSIYRPAILRSRSVSEVKVKNAKIPKSFLAVTVPHGSIHFKQTTMWTGCLRTLQLQIFLLDLYYNILESIFKSITFFTSKLTEVMQNGNK